MFNGFIMAGGGGGAKNALTFQLGISNFTDFQYRIFASVLPGNDYKVSIS